MRKSVLFCLMVVLLSIFSIVMAQDSPRTVITPANGQQIVEIMRLGRGTTDRASFSPDGQTIAVASTVGVWLYDAAGLATALEPPLLATGEAAKGIAFSPDGSVLAVAGNSSVQFWDYRAARSLGSAAFNRSSTSLAFSPDGRLLAINQASGGIVIWDMAANVEYLRIQGSLQGDGAIAFSPDGQMIIASTTDYKVHLWRVADGSEAVVFAGHTRYVYDFLFTPDSAMVVSVSYDKTVQFWNSADGSLLGTLTGTEEERLGEIYSVASSPDGMVLATGHAGGKIVVWDVNNQVTAMIFGPGSGQIIDLAFSPDGRQILSASNEHMLQLWDASSGAEIAAAVGHTNYISAVQFSPDSGTLAIADWDENIWLWNVAAMKQLNYSTPIADITSSSLRNETMLAYSPDNTLLAATEGFDVILLDAATGAEIRRLTDCTGTMMSLAFSPDNSLLAQASSSGLCLFDVATGQRLVFFASPDWLNGVVFSPDQTMIATAGKDHTARVYALP